MPADLAVVDTPILNGIYNTTIRFFDHAGEQATKITRLGNAGDADNLDDALAIVGLLTHAGVSSMSVKQDLETDVSNVSVSQTGLYTLAKLRLVLGFQRVHPLNPGKILTAGYSIPAPINEIVTATNPKRPLMTRGTTLAAAATPATRLGALVDWLETALTYEDVSNVIHVGGWTYVDSRSGLATVAGVIDGDIRT